MAESWGRGVEETEHTLWGNGGRVPLWVDERGAECCHGYHCAVELGSGCTTTGPAGTLLTQTLFATSNSVADPMPFLPSVMWSTNPFPLERVRYIRVLYEVP